MEKERYKDTDLYGRTIHRETGLYGRTSHRETGGYGRIIHREKYRYGRTAHRETDTTMGRQSPAEMIKSKLGSTRGESLAEVLVASLIVAVSLLLLSSMIMASYHIIDRSKEQAEQYYAGISALSDPASAGDKITEKVGTVDVIGSGNSSILSSKPTVKVYVDEDTGLARYGSE